MTRYQKTCISLGLALGMFAAVPALAAPEAAATILMTKDLANMPGKEVTLTPGQTFYEGPNDIHTVGRNASKTKPAKFLVTMVKDMGAPLLTLVK
jgi:hypothetical protein